MIIRSKSEGDKERGRIQHGNDGSRLTHAMASQSTRCQSSSELHRGEKSIQSLQFSTVFREYTGTQHRLRDIINCLLFRRQGLLSITSFLVQTRSLLRYNTGPDCRYHHLYGYRSRPSFFRLHFEFLKQGSTRRTSTTTRRIESVVSSETQADTSLRLLKAIHSPFDIPLAL